MKPKFLRFPGGNYLEGDQIADRFDWKKTLGPLAERPGHMAPWTYRSSDGLGLYEFLLWCEDMNAEPVLAVYAGYSLKGAHVEPGAGPRALRAGRARRDRVRQRARRRRSGARVRAKAGHPAPFTLTYVEVGNEDFFDRSGLVRPALRAVLRGHQGAVSAAQGHLDRRLRAARRTSASTASRRTSSTSTTTAPVDAFLKMARGQYETYDRKGPEIFVGEWGAYETPFEPWNARSRGEAPTPNMRAAIGDAALMTQMERNSDIVVMNCYAPLLVNVSPGARQWRPNLIGYDALRVYGSPSYHAIKLFSTHLGDEILKATAADTDVLVSVTRDSATGTIYAKLVNPADAAAPVQIDLRRAGTLAPTATALTLAGRRRRRPIRSTTAEHVVPVTSTVDGRQAGIHLHGSGQRHRRARRSRPASSSRGADCRRCGKSAGIRCGRSGSSWRRTGSPGRGRAPKSAGRRPGPPAFDPTCYLCPGNARVSGATNPRVHRHLRLRQRPSVRRRGRAA